MTKQQQFCRAYWRWLRRQRTTEPSGADYDLDYWTAEALARQCHGEFEKRRVSRTINSLLAA